MSNQINLNKINKPLIIAEIGLSHSGNFVKAKKLIDICKNSGADVVKFQTHIAEHESTYDEPFRISLGKRFKNRFDYWKKTAFTKIEWKKLIAHCKKKKFIFRLLLFQLRQSE